MEDVKRAATPEAEDVLMQNSYPSPAVDGSHAQFYHIPTQRDQEQVHQQGQEEPHGLPVLSEAPEQHEHHNLHELQELQDTQSPDEQDSHAHAAASVDELQLAARLSQDLAPIMAAAQQQAQEAQAHVQAQVQVQAPQEEEAIHGPVDSDIHEQLQAQLDSHTHELQNAQQPANQPQPHHYGDPQPHPQLHPGLQLSQLHSPQLHSPYQIPDNTPPRKRSKVSRACDECRRKKIKCDAPSDTAAEPCSNCRRSSAQCLFSRVPQKRGPSKG